MVSGLTPPSKSKDSLDLREDFNDLRDIVRYGGRSINTSDTTGFGIGGTSTQTPSVNGLFAINPIEVVESVALTWNLPVTPTGAELKIGDVVSSSVSGWTGKLVSVLSESSSQIRGVFEPTNPAVPDFTNTTPQTLTRVSGGWSATYILNSWDPNLLVLNTSNAIVKTVDDSNPIIDTIIGTVNDGQSIWLKPKFNKTLTINAGANIDLSSPLNITHNNFVQMNYYRDNTSPSADGNYIIEGIGGGGGVTTINAIKEPCRVATNFNYNLGVGLGENIDGTVVVTGDRILIKSQTTQSENGIYVVTGVTLGIASVTRASDFNSGSNVKASTLVAIEEGTLFADNVFVLTSDHQYTPTKQDFIIGTDNLIFQNLSTSAGDDLGNHTAITSLKMNDFAIFLDTALQQSIVALSLANNHTVPNGGAHDFYVDLPSNPLPRFGITETDVNANVPIYTYNASLSPVSKFLGIGITGANEGAIETDSALLHVSIGGATRLTMDVSTNTVFTQRSYDNGIPQYQFWRDDSTPTANDIMSLVQFYGNDSALNKQLYASIEVDATNITHLSESSKMILALVEQGIFGGTEFDFKPHLLEMITQTEVANGFEVKLYRNDASPLTNDVIASFQFEDKDNAGNRTTYAEINSLIASTVDTSEAGILQFKTRHLGPLKTSMQINGSVGVDLYLPTFVHNDVGGTNSIGMWVTGGNDPYIETNSPIMYTSVGGATRLTMDVTVNTEHTLSSFANGIPIFAMYRNDSTPTDLDLMGKIQFIGNDSSLAKTIYAEINGYGTDITNGTEDGTIDFDVRIAGGISLTNVMSVGASGATFPIGLTSSGTSTSIVSSNIFLGDSGADSLSVVATSTFLGNMTISGTATFDFDALLIKENPATGTNSGLFTVANLTASRTYTFPDATGDVPLLNTSNAFTGSTNSFAGTSFSVTCGSIFLGDATSDTLTVTARVNSTFEPSTSLTRDLGTSSLLWNNLFINDVQVNTRVRSNNTTEIGIYVTNSSASVGSAGTLRPPYIVDATTYSTGVNATLDGFFGALDGAIGIQYRSGTNIIWIRLNGSWRQNFLT